MAIEHLVVGEVFLGFTHLESQTTIYKWLFQFELDDLYDFNSLHRNWLFHQTSILSWLFGGPSRHQLFEYMQNVMLKPSSETIP